MWCKNKFFIPGKRSDLSFYSLYEIIDHPRSTLSGQILTDGFKIWRYTMIGFGQLLSGVFRFGLFTLFSFEIRLSDLLSSDWIYIIGNDNIWSSFFRFDSLNFKVVLRIGIYRVIWRDPISSSLLLLLSLSLLYRYIYVCVRVVYCIRSLVRKEQESTETCPYIYINRKT